MPDRSTARRGYDHAVHEVDHLAINADDVDAEATVTVEDLDACLDRAQEAGGRVVMRPSKIPGVGTVAFVTDPAGNPLGFLQRVA